MPEPPALDFSALHDAAFLVAKVIGTGIPQPPWFPYRWVRVHQEPSGRWYLEVSEREEWPW